MNDNAAPASKPTFQFDYTNHEGRATRPRVLVDSCALWYGATEWHPEKQMLMKAFDVDKGEGGAWRDYAVANIVWPGELLFGLRLAWNAVNVLGAPASAHGDGQDCERCKGIGEALEAIDEVNVQLGGEAFYSKRVLQSMLADAVGGEAAPTRKFMMSGEAREVPPAFNSPIEQARYSNIRFPRAPALVVTHSFVRDGGDASSKGSLELFLSESELWDLLEARLKTARVKVETLRAELEAAELARGGGNG